jgi:uncharacterized membrane protein
MYVCVCVYWCTCTIFSANAKNRGLYNTLLSIFLLGIFGVMTTAKETHPTSKQKIIDHYWLNSHLEHLCSRQGVGNKLNFNIK